MRRVIASEFITLDGFMSDPKDEMDWVLDIFNEEIGQEIKDQQNSVDTIILGRLTYEIMAPYWPAATADTEDPMMIDHMNNTPKIVFSRTLDRVEWQNSRLARGIDPDEISKMKQQPGKDMAIVGSASIVQAFASLGLIDEYRLLVHPVILGTGKPLFKDIKDRVNLKLVRARTFSSGVVALDYQSDRQKPA